MTLIELNTLFIVDQKSIQSLSFGKVPIYYELQGEITYRSTFHVKK